KGFTHLRVDGRFEPTARWPRLDRFREHTIELPVGDLIVYADDEARLRTHLKTALEHGRGNLSILWPLDRLKEALAGGHTDIELETRSYSTQRACASCGTSFPEPDPRLFSYNSKHGWCSACFGTGLVLPGFNAEQSGEENVWQDDNAHPDTCAHCHGARLNPTALAVRWQERSIAELAAETVSAAHDWFNQLKLLGRDQSIAQDLLQEMRARLAFLEEVGLGYLALDRAAPTLSGGEAQRIRLAAQLGSNLQGVCYVLDEPTIGLHARDNHILLGALAQLQAKGNTLVVVEHDEDTLRRANHLIDIGPGAGTRGGRIVAQGTLDALMHAPESITGRYLKTPLPIPSAPRRPAQSQDTQLSIQGAQLHNLKNLNARIPLARLTVITGVSGSGKSSLARDCLLANAAQQLAARNNKKPAPAWQGCTHIAGLDAIDRVLEVDQTPIGKTPRSCPATYVGFWDKIRALFADTQEARMRGWAAARFSFNSGPGRCPACDGQGVRTIEMNF
ncbi:MAG TPA: excinuclease ABC subunit A, partial [Burkholderiaceae bacterium]|nr:excinuclease ABC subunit A [Burkholderiaceae bacterium]